MAKITDYHDSVTTCIIAAWVTDYLGMMESFGRELDVHRGRVEAYEQSLAYLHMMSLRDVKEQLRESMRGSHAAQER